MKSERALYAKQVSLGGGAKNSKGRAPRPSGRLSRTAPDLRRDRLGTTSTGTALGIFDPPPSLDLRTLKGSGRPLRGLVKNFRRKGGLRRVGKLAARSREGPPSPAGSTFLVPWR